MIIIFLLRIKSQIYKIMKEIMHQNLQKECNYYKKNQKEERKCKLKFIKKNIKKKLKEN